MGLSLPLKLHSIIIFILNATSHAPSRLVNLLSPLLMHLVAGVSSPEQDFEVVGVESTKLLKHVRLANRKHSRHLHRPSSVMKFLCFIHEDEFFAYPSLRYAHP